MTQVFDTHLFSGKDPDQNMVRMNSLLLNLVSQAQPDCQSMPLKTYFADFFTEARFSIENTFDKLLSTKPIELRPTKIFSRFLEDRAWVDTIQYRAEIPEGLIVSYLEYLAILIPAQERANKILKDVIEPFSKFVGRLVSDEIFRNQPGHQIKDLSNLEQEYLRITKDFSKCFGKNDFRASAAFGEVVRRNADWSDVFAGTKNLRDLYQAFPHKEIIKQLNTLYDTLDALIEQIKLDHYDRVEKDVTRLLSVGMYQIAKEIELASLITYRSKTFVTCINTTIVNIEQIVKMQK